MNEVLPACSAVPQPTGLSQRYYSYLKYKDKPCAFDPRYGDTVCSPNVAVKRNILCRGTFVYRISRSVSEGGVISRGGYTGFYSIGVTDC